MSGTPVVDRWPAVPEEFRRRAAVLGRTGRPFAGLPAEDQEFVALHVPRSRPASAAALAGDHILQQVVDADRVTVEFAHRASGELRTPDVPAVLGPMTYGRRTAGLHVRHGSPAGGDLINVHRGAAVNSVLVVESPGDG
ncbi:hypothetical protein ACFC1R_04550 [Kitasatospora sp. NPDC056138]|uniref:hypothetical protein n=1 Tax=Kitasatospora sp. NPDC056138 TaxID=3345724 RepID=UPI0035DC0788